MRVLPALLLLALAQPAPTLTVSAPVSMTNVLEAIRAAFADAGGGPLRFNFAGSNVLARQIVSGAPVDVFISADEDQMRLVEEAGLMHERTCTGVVGNQLVIVTAPAYRGVITEPLSLVSQKAIRLVAIGDPAAVPAGVYARRYLESLGLYQRLLPKLVPTSNVRAALAAVENGSAQAAIVYVTDLAVARLAEIAYRVPVAEGPRIVYPAAVLKDAPHRAEAERFLRFLMGQRAAAIFQEHGFIPLAPGDPCRP